MRRIFLLLVLALVLPSCATKTLLRYEKGEKIIEKVNLREEALDSYYEVQTTPLQHQGKEVLVLEILENKPKKQYWTDTYVKNAVYEERCKGWMGQNSEDEDYCKFKGSQFFLSHIALYGFILDLSIPFQEYGNPKITTEKTDEILTQDENAIVNNVKNVVVETSCSLLMRKNLAYTKIKTDIFFL